MALHLIKTILKVLFDLNGGTLLEYTVIFTDEDTDMSHLHIVHILY